MLAAGVAQRGRVVGGWVQAQEVRVEERVAEVKQVKTVVKVTEKVRVGAVMWV